MSGAARQPEPSAVRTRAWLVRVAVPSPLRRTFDYLPPEPGAALPPVGCRVRVPFGRTRRIGVVLEHGEASDLPRSRLKRVQAVLDAEPLVARDMLAFLRWSSEYFHHPVGEVVLGALPAALRQGRSASVAAPPRRWHPSAAGRALDPCALARAPRQALVLRALRS
ncbi:MAG: hypothetical protein R3286_20070, partial [Gammaproteobacteria bacterium]|nr:hypothetical protein [Gammaproteobacteria bacterium]